MKEEQQTIQLETATLTKKGLRQRGRHITRGALKEIWSFLLTVACGILLAHYIAMAFGWGMDSSDKDKWHRSGLYTYVDAATGVNYVGVGPFGGMCVRVTTNGTPFISKP
jgi:hypothetical protein